MLPEIGAAEMLVIAAVALIVVGPKDLPVLMRTVARFLARLRGMAAEFRNSFDEMARQSELDELRREVEALRNGSYLRPVARDLNDTFRNLDGDLRATPQMTPLEPAAEPATAANSDEGVRVEPEPERVREAGA